MPTEPLTRDQSVRLAVIKIREAVALGLNKSGAPSPERIMIAFATCDRHLWCPDSKATASELWQRLDERQHEAVAIHLNAN